MKKIISKLLYVALILSFAAACVPEEYGTKFDYTPFVQVTTPTVSISENADPAEAVVKVQYVGPKLSQDLTVTFQVTLDGPGDDVTLPGATVVIKAGEFTANSVVTFENNFFNDGNKVVTLKLASTSSPDVVLATEGTKKDLGVVTIVDDDCPFDVSEWVGAYKMDLTLDKDFIFPAGEYLDNSLTLEAGDQPNTLIDTDFMFLSGADLDPVPVTFEFDPVAATANIVGTPFTFGDGTSDDNTVHAYNDAPNRRFFTNGDASGELSTCSKSFIIRAKVRREDGSVGQVMTFRYVKQ